MESIATPQQAPEHESAVTLDLARIRAQFPALALRDEAHPRVYFDNPAGTQVPRQVVDAMRDCLLHHNANLGGSFVTSVAAEEIVHGARAAMADLLGAQSPSEIVFGQNMTSLTFHLARSLGRQLSAGDEVIVTRMEHDANVTPWVLMARDAGLRVRYLDFDHERYEFDAAQLETLLNKRTRLLCVGLASNVLGTVNDVATLGSIAREAGAMVFVDAVHHAPHGLIDVQTLGCDLLACSAYKFFGPHQGILWGKQELLASLEPYRLRPAPSAPPGNFETGTQSHEGLAGVTAAVDYLASLAGEPTPGTPRRERLVRAMRGIERYERGLSRQLIAGLQQLDGVRIHGVTAHDRLAQRTPTVSFTVEGMRPRTLADKFAARNVFTWSGDNYAVEPIDALGLRESGGVLRTGLVHYNLPEEIASFLELAARIIEYRGKRD